ncbi:PEP/pyruvate-binding domain-containing protein [Nonomuraea gerenzanensis]|uniref:Phosphoenolpyruvate synthase n=1 Tax=Nonomuraea gerenzanensis TaxID=93944 RepID=A0A1M4E431_9ACTN|nr:PEP/pyruvate-binding domain-containing protein [Nonomuraea gerenzanensis]UBU15754.1 phosphoenolpyruvate synthase [Nonomuraea gerenzanensis]SBO93534.1 Phosphoenolpyruvate synthase [Nonomuraea gerenzanensis]
MKLVAPLRAFGRADLATAGGKGANLGELVRNGFPVPDGFVVTTYAYELVAQGGGTRFEQVELPGELRRAITDAYAGLGGGPVAVRSSATAEDLPGAAFAGQQDTYLNVVGEPALIDAVRRCWGSLWNERAVAYRARLGISDSEVRIAVVVQRMVEAEVAGVLFTADPVSGDRGRLVIDASSGLGEAVVSGLVTPDHYVVDGRGRVDFTPGRREVVIRSAAGGGVVRETAARARAERPVGGAERLPDVGGAERLPDEVVAELGRLGREVAAQFGRPQDIEWAYAQGRLHLLQARPMTALPPPPVGRLNPFQRRLATVLMEYLPERPYPIDMSTWVPHGPAGLMRNVLGSFGVRRAFDDFLQEEDGVVYRMLPPSPKPTVKVLAAPFRVLAKARRYDPARWTEDRRFRDYLASVEALRGRDLRAMTWGELLRVPRQALALVGPVADLRVDYLPGTGVALLRLLVAVRVLGRGEVFADLLHGARTRTTDANAALERLAEVARRTGALEADPVPAEFAEAMAAFLDEFGHRETASPILVTPPTWADAPEVVLGLVRMLTSGSAMPHSSPARQESPSSQGLPAPQGPGARKEGDDALGRLLAHPLLRGKGRRARMTRWVQAARAGVAFREDSHFFFMMPQPILRRSLLELGRRLCDAGVLDVPEAVFHLRLEELEEIEDVTALRGPHAERLRETVARRALKREELAGVRLIDPAAIFPPAETGDALLTGAPVGGGSATGPVKVIATPAEFGRLAAGDVLVCPYTNPSWTPLFQHAAAVVVDTGGAASHAAIVAREYGIPAVMGTGTGTSTLQDGQLVTVNGDTGTVTSPVTATAGGGPAAGAVTGPGAS